METAFVLINVVLGEEPSVMKGLEGINEVIEAHKIYGAYDIIARIEAESMDKIKEILHYELRLIQGIRSTMTLIVT